MRAHRLGQSVEEPLTRLAELLGMAAGVEEDHLVAGAVVVHGPHAVLLPQREQPLNLAGVEHRRQHARPEDLSA